LTGWKQTLHDYDCPHKQIEAHQRALGVDLVEVFELKLGTTDIILDLMRCENQGRDQSDQGGKEAELKIPQPKRITGPFDDHLQVDA
jgi:hypothetical protein